MSFFNNVLLLPTTRCQEEDSMETIDLTIKTIRTEEGTPYSMTVVREAKMEYAEAPFGSHDYLPILGHEGFRKAATELVLGVNSPAIKEGRSFGVQCLSGTGALRSGAEFLSHVLGLGAVYVSNPSWGIHKEIFKRSGFVSIKEYGYWNDEKKNINIGKLIADLELAPPKAVVILHACAHSPTGMDPDRTMWKLIADVIKRRQLFSFFDISYQGLASGNPDIDAWPIRYFVEQGLEMFVAQSFAINFGLYSERVGNLTVVSNNATLLVQHIPSQMTRVNVSKFSNPPAFGSCVVHRILSTPVLKAKWLDEIKELNALLNQRRCKLYQLLRDLKTPGSWDHLQTQTGLFNFLGLTSHQINHLRTQHNIKIFQNGSFNLSGLFQKDIKTFAVAIDETIRCADIQEFAETI